MAHLVVETLWHFAGFFHIAEMLDYTPVHYSGASVPWLSPYEFGGVQASSGQGYYFAHSAPPVRLQVTVDASSDLSEHFYHIRQSYFHGSTGAAAIPMLPVNGVGQTPPGDLSFGTDLKITISYIDVPGMTLDVGLYQHNSLFNNNILLGDPQLADELPVGPDVRASLDQLVGDINALLPALPGLSGETDVAAGAVLIDWSGLPGGPFSGAADGTSLLVPDTSQYVDGVRTDDAGNQLALDGVLAASSAQQEAALTDFWKTQAGVQLSPYTDTVTNSTFASIVNTGTPSGGYAQDLITGSDHALNIAVMVSTTNAASSLVVQGDLHITNAIYQFNVLQNANTIQLDGTAIAEQLMTQQNAVTNSATFLHEPGTLAGDGVSGFSGATNWNVTYVNGDYWNVTSLQQQNVLINGNIAQQTAENTHFTATLGADHQLNIADVSQPTSGFDLVIVGGNYYELNAIVQVNLVMDNASITEVDGGVGGAGSQSISTGGNTLTNNAVIATLGSDSFKPITVEAAALAGLIGNHGTSADALQTLGIPGNGTDTLNVLYVKGNYYDDHVLVQTNLIVNPAIVEQLALHGAQGIPGADTSGGLSQSASTGGDSAINLAAIVTQGSTSGYQYVGGQTYDDNMLVQADLVSGADTIGGSNLHPDVVAAIAAMTPADFADAYTVPSDYGPSTGGGHSSDVLASVLS